MNKSRLNKEELNRLYNTPENRPLKYTALGVITVVIIILLYLIFRIDEISLRTMLLLRACAGAGALIFVVLVGVLTYRVNKQYIKNRNGRK